MKKILLSTILILAFAVTSYAIPVTTAEYGNVTEKNYSPAQDVCYLGYYNFCSGWVWYWSGYCYGTFTDQELVQIGTCFDLADCPEDCRHLDYSYWGCKRYTSYGYADIEIYCADDNCCPIGQPLAGIYGYNVDVTTPWQLFLWDGLELCPCDAPPGTGTGNFIQMVTAPGAMYAHFTYYSDINSYNIDAGCATAWKCAGHSYCYTNVVNYCDTYGTPGPLWVSGYGYGCTNFPAVPPGCHDYFYPTGYFTDLLMDAYISCLGATATDDASWSQIKALYK